MYKPSLLFELINSEIFNFVIENEGKEYHASQFILKGKHVLFRKAKQTPKKVGQFVTCWKRNKNGITVPFNEKDVIDYYFIHVLKGVQEGLFIFPKSELIKRGIMTTSRKDGKRGFRIYPAWDNPKSKQAIKTQQWQINYFTDLLDTDKINYLMKE